jgi:chloramphenicol 3-O-phosphotransferase
LLHAAAAERDGSVMILAGPEGSGKSTLVAALVRSGLRYVTDETVAVDLAAGTIAPYAKPIALHETEQCQRLVPAQTIRPDAVATSGGNGRLLVLLGGYQAGRATAARAIPRAEAAVALAEQAFNFRTLGPGRLDAVAEVVRACDCYRLEVGDLDAGCRLVLDLFERAAPSR